MPATLDFAAGRTAPESVFARRGGHNSGSSVDAVKCVRTIQKLSRKYSWFKASVRDIRMLRIEENNDLLPTIIDGEAS